jgi:RimJ/RimL family protein N-acetyltransferase
MATRPDGWVPGIAHGSVYLRPAERDDVPRMVGWLSDARTSRTLALIAPLSLVHEERWLEDAVSAQGRTQWHFVVCGRDDDRPLGMVGLHELDERNGNASLGIVIGDEADRGKGHGSDALQAILGFTFGSLRLERVWLDVYDFNPAARRVYERAGFTTEGVLRHALWREDRFVDVVRMSILHDEWRAGRQGAASGESGASGGSGASASGASAEPGAPDEPAG